MGVIKKNEKGAINSACSENCVNLSAQRDVEVVDTPVIKRY